MDERREFLLHLFDKLWDDIGSTNKVIWQTITILFGAIATVIFTKKNIVPITTAYSVYSALTRPLVPVLLGH